MPRCMLPSMYNKPTLSTQPSYQTMILSKLISHLKKMVRMILWNLKNTFNLLVMIRIHADAALKKQKTIC